jgi:hypothetical protein
VLDYTLSHSRRQQSFNRAFFMHERKWSVYYCLRYFMVGNPQLLHVEGIKENTAGWSRGSQLRPLTQVRHTCEIRSITEDWTHLANFQSSLSRNFCKVWKVKDGHFMIRARAHWSVKIRVSRRTANYWCHNTKCFCTCRWTTSDVSKWKLRERERERKKKKREM